MIVKIVWTSEFDETDEDGNISMMAESFNSMRMLLDADFNLFLMKVFQKRLQTVKISVKPYGKTNAILLEGPEKNIVLLLLFFISQDSTLPSQFSESIDEDMSVKDLTVMWQYLFPTFRLIGA